MFDEEEYDWNFEELEEQETPEAPTLQIDDISIKYIHKGNSYDITGPEGKLIQIGGCTEGTKPYSDGKFYGCIDLEKKQETPEAPTLQIDDISIKYIHKGNSYDITGPEGKLIQIGGCTEGTKPYSDGKFYGCTDPEKKQDKD